MSKIRFIIVFGVLFFGATVVLYAQSSVDKKIQAMEDTIKVMQMQYKLDSTRNALDNARKKQAVKEGTEVAGPCPQCNDNELKELYSSSKFLIGVGYGKPGPGDDLRDRGIVYANAVADAKSRIADSWIGFSKNMTEEYYERNTGTDNNTKEKFKRVVQSSGELIINQPMNIICCSTEIIKNGPYDAGHYECTVVASIDISKIEETIKKEAEGVINLDPERLQESISKTAKKTIQITSGSLGNK